MTLAPELEGKIKGLVENNPVLLFMKGTRTFPQCGFSAAVVDVLDEYLESYETFNVLGDPNVREGIKEFSDWPTIPQLYVEGEFVGGCDIVRDMHGSGELSDVLKTKPIEITLPKIDVTDTAAEAFKAAAEEDDYPHLRLHITPSFQYELAFGPEEPGDLVVECNSLSIRIDKGTARRADGMRIDFIDNDQGQGFKIDNPNEPPKVQQLSVKTLKKRLDDGELKFLFDVRPADERAQASLETAIALDDGGEEKLSELDKATPIAFLCHHGGRSQAAAQHFLQQGFTDVYNVVGGIDAWATDVDANTPRY